MLLSIVPKSARTIDTMYVFKHDYMYIIDILIYKHNMLCVMFYTF